MDLDVEATKSKLEALRGEHRDLREAAPKLLRYRLWQSLLGLMPP